MNHKKFNIQKIYKEYQKIRSQLYPYEYPYIYPKQVWSSPLTVEINLDNIFSPTKNKIVL